MQQSGKSVVGQLPQLWRSVFAAQVSDPDKYYTDFSSRVFDANLYVFSSLIEDLVRNGIVVDAFERVRLLAEVEGEEIAVIQRCPIKNFAKTKWLPAYSVVRSRFLIEKPALIPEEKPVLEVRDLKK